MLVTLVDMKKYLGIDPLNTTYDEFLTGQIKLVSEAIEMYCQRSFNLRKFKQTFYREDLYEVGIPRASIKMYHFPIVEVESLKVLGKNSNTLVSADTVKIHKPTSMISARREGSPLFGSCGDIEITYTAGFVEIPEVVRHTIFSIVKERYMKKISGIDIDFGSDVQSVSIPGVININYDYSLENNSRESTFGVILGSYRNSLDYLRSERTILGSSLLEYVEDVT